MIQKRYFIIGSEWLYYKIYTGIKTSDLLLETTISTTLTNYVENGLIDKWFFIRYYDSDYHLRLRLHLKDSTHLGIIIQKLYENLFPFVKTLQIHDIQIGTYKREIERYGLNNIEDVEWLFYYDSELVLNILKQAQISSNDKWLLSVKAIDMLLSLWGLDLISKKITLDNMRNYLINEFGTSKQNRKQLNLKYRLNKGKIEDILSMDISYFNTFLNNCSLIIKKIKSINNDAKNIDLIYSLIHMHCNRAFDSNQRLKEWIVYDLLYQHYKSQLGRQINYEKAQI